MPSAPDRWRQCETNLRRQGQFPFSCVRMAKKVSLSLGADAATGANGCSPGRDELTICPSAFVNWQSVCCTRSLSLEERKWRRGESNPCPRRYPRKHLHVYPAINSEEPSHAPAHCRLPSVHEIDSRTGAVAPPIRQPAVHVCRRSRRPTTNVAIN